jgi:hypothetical protein
MDIEAQRKLAEARAEARKKKTGDISPIVKPAELKQGTDFLRNEFTLGDTPAARTLGQTLVERAKRAMIENKGLTAEEARTEAFRGMQREGAFVGLERIPKAPGAHVSTALPLPELKDGSLDKSKLVPGTWYSQKGGETRQYFGADKGFGPSTGRGLIKPSASGYVQPMSADEDDEADADADAEALADDDEDEEDE